MFTSAGNSHTCWQTSDSIGQLRDGLHNKSVSFIVFIFYLSFFSWSILFSLFLSKQHGLSLRDFHTADITEGVWLNWTRRKEGSIKIELELDTSRAICPISGFFDTCKVLNSERIYTYIWINRVVAGDLEEYLKVSYWYFTSARALVSNSFDSDRFRNDFITFSTFDTISDQIGEKIDYYISRPVLRGN